MNLRQAAQQALEALETNNKAWKHLADSGDAGFWEAEEQPFYEISVKAITALRAALAEPEQNPFGDDAGRYARKLHEEREAYKALLTEHKSQTTHWEGCEAVHPECKEKNT